MLDSSVSSISLQLYPLLVSINASIVSTSSTALLVQQQCQGLRDSFRPIFFSEPRMQLCVRTDGDYTWQSIQIKMPHNPPRHSNRELHSTPHRNEIWTLRVQVTPTQSTRTSCNFSIASAALLVGREDIDGPLDFFSPNSLLNMIQNASNGETSIVVGIFLFNRIQLPLIVHDWALRIYCFLNPFLLQEGAYALGIMQRWYMEWPWPGSQSGYSVLEQEQVWS